MAEPSLNHHEIDSPRALITALGIGQVCAWGSLYYSFPLIAEAMMAELGWSKTDVYGAATIGLVLAGFLAYPVGVAIDKGYGRLIMGGDSLMAGILLALWSQVDSLSAYCRHRCFTGSLAVRACVRRDCSKGGSRQGPSRYNCDNVVGWVCQHPIYSPRAAFIRSFRMA